MIRWEEVEVASHQFHVGAADADLTAVTGETDVFELHTNVLIVHTGIVSGPVRVGVEVLSGRPESLGAEWENSAEATVRAEKEISVVSVDGDVASSLGIPAPSGEDFVTLRVSTRRRAEEWGEAVTTSMEAYLIEAWPCGSATPVRQVKSGDGLWAAASAPATETFDPSEGTEDATVRLFGPQRWRG